MKVNGQSYTTTAWSPGKQPLIPIEQEAESPPEAV